jgi:hypothetical protein
MFRNSSRKRATVSFDLGRLDAFVRRAELGHWRRERGTIDFVRIFGMAELTLAQFAELTLRLERGELRADVLREADMTEQQWLEAQMAWLERMAAQLERQRSQLFDRYLAVRASAAQDLGGAHATMGASVRPRVDGGRAMTESRSDEKEATAAASTGFIKVDPPALYTPPAAGAPRAAPAEAGPAQPPLHLSEAYAPPPVVAPAFMPRPAGVVPAVAPPAAVAPPPFVAPAIGLSPPAAVSPPSIVSPPAAVTPHAAIAPPAFVSAGAVAPPAVVVPPAPVAPPAVVPPPAFVAPPAFVSPPAAVPQSAFAAPPAFVSAPATPPPAAPGGASARPAFASRTAFGTVVRRAQTPAPTVAFTPAAPRNDAPVPAAPLAPAPTAMPPRAPAPQMAAAAAPAKTYEPTMAFFVSPNAAGPTPPSVPTPPPPSDRNEPTLALTQLALLVAELTAFPDRSAATLSESGLDESQWQREWAAWQKRFAEQPAERARYEPLVQYYTALRKPGP